MIVLGHVSYRHAGAARPALRDVSLTLAEGEVVGLVGANDAGKSTLCLVAGGLAPRVVGGELAGSVVVDGVDARSLPAHELAARVGVAFQNPETQLSGISTTVYEEVAFGPANLGVPRADVISRTDRALQTLAITGLAARDPGRLSGGQRQLVALAGLLAMSPRHLVLDEPTGQLDPHGTRLVGEAIERLAAAGVGILVAEHRTDLLAARCSRVVALDRGAVALEGPADAVLSDPRLRTLGVAEPARVRLQRLAAAAGLSVPLPHDA